MVWARRVVLALPFSAAAVLNVLVNIARPLDWRSEHIDGYCFLFATPWGWLLDSGWFGSFDTRWLDTLMTFLILLWIPALLYSWCLWLLLRVSRVAMGRIRG
jgi:hypothetical protein